MTQTSSRAHINRLNAQKSTGPKSAAGKAAVAGNARRHGVTAKPAPGDVAAWLSVILGRAQLPPSALLPQDVRGEAALMLARAEALLSAAEAALRDHIVDMVAPQGGVTPDASYTRLRLLKRYTAEAQSRRRKALDRWLSIAPEGEGA